MDKLYNTEAASCSGKEKLVSRSAARAAIRRIDQRAKKTNRRDRGAQLREYRCPYCGSWHIGGWGDER